MPQDTHIEITFAPEKLSLDSLETLADDLGLHIVSIVDNVLSGYISGKVLIGGLGSGFVDLDGRDIGVTVDFQSVTLRTTVHAKYITSMLVNGIEMHPMYQPVKVNMRAT